MSFSDPLETSDDESQEDSEDADSTPPSPQIPFDPVESAHFDAIMKKQAETKAYYDSFPNVEDATNQTTPDIKKAEEFTKAILDNKPSGNPSDKGTACHVLSQLFGNQGQGCLFYNSTAGINLHDASANLADITSAEQPFVLKLSSSEGLGNINGLKTEKDDVKLAEILNQVIQQKQFHPITEDILDRLAKAHGLDKKYIVIKTVYAGTFNIVYTVSNLMQTTVNNIIAVATKLRAQFAKFVSQKIHPLLFRPSFDISFFDARGDKTFPSQPETHQLGPPGHTKLYTSPAGWARYGLKVLGKYGSDDWLHPFGHAGNWYRAFHGTGSAQQVDFNGCNAFSDPRTACVDAFTSIFVGGFRPARVAVYGPGVYCSPGPAWLGNTGFVGTVELDTTQGKKKFKCMFQVAVNPNGVNCATNDIWVVPNPQDIRPYGILIKEV